jgi:hypothetical protein
MSNSVTGRHAEPTTPRGNPVLSWHGHATTLYDSLPDDTVPGGSCPYVWNPPMAAPLRLPLVPDQAALMLCPAHIKSGKFSAAPPEFSFVINAMISDRLSEMDSLLWLFLAPSANGLEIRIRFPDYPSSSAAGYLVQTMNK